MTPRPNSPQNVPKKLIRELEIKHLDLLRIGRKELSFPKRWVPQEGQRVKAWLECIQHELAEYYEQCSHAIEEAYPNVLNENASEDNEVDDTDNGDEVEQKLQTYAAAAYVLTSRLAVHLRGTPFEGLPDAIEVGEAMQALKDKLEPVRALLRTRFIKNPSAKKPESDDQDTPARLKQMNEKINTTRRQAIVEMDQLIRDCQKIYDAVKARISSEGADGEDATEEGPLKDAFEAEYAEAINRCDEVHERLDKLETLNWMLERKGCKAIKLMCQLFVQPDLLTFDHISNYGHSGRTSDGKPLAENPQEL